jgi:hypothetical protein
LKVRAVTKLNKLFIVSERASLGFLLLHLSFNQDRSFAIFFSAGSVFYKVLRSCNDYPLSAQWHSDKTAYHALEHYDMSGASN